MITSSAVDTGLDIAGKVVDGFEKLLGLAVPKRAQLIRVLYSEIGRLLSHLLNVTTFAMDVGAMTVFLLTFTEREKIYNLIEQISGARDVTKTNTSNADTLPSPTTNTLP